MVQEQISKVNLMAKMKDRVEVINRQQNEFKKIIEFVKTASIPRDDEQQLLKLLDEKMTYLEDEVKQLKADLNEMVFSPNIKEEDYEEICNMIDEGFFLDDVDEEMEVKADFMRKEQGRENTIKWD